MIARRRLIDRTRARGRRVSAEPLAEDPAVAARPAPDRLDTADDAARAASALTTLSPDQQRVLKLSVYQGLSHEQIAQATGIPLGTVKTHIRRGLIRIREMLSAEPSPKGASA
jgi:RNA polymerase sigma-70 factor (ECF subfamily)